MYDHHLDSPEYTLFLARARSLSLSTSLPASLSRALSLSRMSGFMTATITTVTHQSEEIFFDEEPEFVDAQVSLSSLWLSCFLSLSLPPPSQQCAAIPS